jgi:hypothetical protein
MLCWLVPNDCLMTAPQHHYYRYLRWSAPGYQSLILRTNITQAIGRKDMQLAKGNVTYQVLCHSGRAMAAGLLRTVCRSGAA